MPPKTTARDVATRCGVSVTTVNDILSGRKAHLYRESTREAVHAAAEGLGFRPNAAARAVASGRFDTVAVIAAAGGHSAQLRSDILAGIEEESVAQGITIAFSRLRQGAHGPEASVLQVDAVDGCIVLPDLQLDALRQIGSRLPIVHANYAFDTDSVYPDESAAARRGTSMLLASGVATVAYADFGFGFHASAADRRDGYLAAMQEAGMPPYLDLAQGLAKSEWPQRARTLLAALPRPAGIVCYGTSTALVLLRAGYELGWRLPADLRLLTFCGAEISDFFGLPLAALHVPQYQVGIEAMRLLAQRLRDPSRALPTVRVPYDPARDMISDDLRPLLRPHS